MKRVPRAFPLLAVLLAAAPVAAQGGGTRPVANGARIVTQTLAVPVFPGQMVNATLSMPTLEQAPLPAVLLLAVREPGAAPAASALALSNALLARGIAVVRLDVLPDAEPATGADPLDQPADDAFAVLQFMREREDIDGDRVGVVGLGGAAPHAARATALDEVAAALVLLGAEPVASDTLGLPTGLPLLSLPLEVRAAPAGATVATPVTDAAIFLSRHLQ